MSEITHKYTYEDNLTRATMKQWVTLEWVNLSIISLIHDQYSIAICNLNPFLSILLGSSIINVNRYILCRTLQSSL